MKSFKQTVVVLMDKPIIGPPLRLMITLWQLPGFRERLQLISNQVERLESDLHNQKQTAEYLAQSLQQGTERTEFVRRELMYEMRYGASDTRHGSDTLKVESRVVSPGKLQAARDHVLKINLGCGHLPLADYLNVDRRPLDGVDIVAEVDDLPLEAGEVDEIYSAHLLEHFPQEQLLREVIPYWSELLREGGVFRAVVPDAEAMIRGYSAGSYSYSDLREVTFGAQDYDGDFHYNMFTPESLSTLLSEAGFESVEIIASGRKNGACFEFEIQATRKKAI